MTLDPSKNTLEQQKFVETPEGNVAVRTLNIGGFIDAAVGNKITVAYPSAITETYTYKNGATTYKVLLVTYTDSTKANVSEVERTA